METIQLGGDSPSFLLKRLVLTFAILQSSSTVALLRDTLHTIVKMLATSFFNNSWVYVIRTWWLTDI